MWPEGLARPTTANIKVFTPTVPAATNLGWQTWTKPPGCSHVYIIACGGGGSGGKNTGGNQTVGAGGGGSGVLGRALFPSFILPDTLFFRIGQGGLTRTTAGTGNPGIATTVAVDPESTSTATNILLLCNGGGGGGGTAASTAGAAGTVPTNVNQQLSSWGFWQVASRSGQTGATASNGSAAAYLIEATGSGVIVNGGTGGGNGTGSGGAITVITERKTWTPVTGAATQTNGVSAINNTALLFNMLTSNMPVVFQGGTGGGGTNVSGAGTPAGAGGAGSWGCGGGGGGNSNLNGGVSGNGGAGGNGFAIVIAF